MDVAVSHPVFPKRIGRCRLPVQVRRKDRDACKTFWPLKEIPLHQQSCMIFVQGRRRRRRKRRGRRRRGEIELREGNRSG